MSSSDIQPSLQDREQLMRVWAVRRRMALDAKKWLDSDSSGTPSAVPSSTSLSPSSNSNLNVNPNPSSTTNVVPQQSNGATAERRSEHPSAASSNGNSAGNAGSVFSGFSDRDKLFLSRMEERVDVFKEEVLREVIGQMAHEKAQSARLEKELEWSRRRIAELEREVEKLRSVHSR
eukprot:ANDGO_02259.mRNA.1 hypothetical protein